MTLPADPLGWFLTLVREAAREGSAQALAAQATPASPVAAPLLNKRELARALDVSPATITRLDPPHVFVGASPRYSLDEVRAWLAARGRQGTKAPPSTRETIAGVRLLSRRAR